MRYMVLCLPRLTECNYVFLGEDDMRVCMVLPSSAPQGTQELAACRRLALEGAVQDLPGKPSNQPKM